MRKITLLCFSLFLFISASQAQKPYTIKFVPEIIALYKNAGNTFKVKVDSLGDDVNLNFKIKGAELYPGNEKNEITLCPNTPNVTLYIYRDSILLGEKYFGVRLIPKPSIILSTNGEGIIERKGIDKKTKNFVISAECDESFAYYLPKDSSYTVKSWKLLLVREGKVVAEKTCETSIFYLKEFGATIKSGDRVVIEISKVSRLNFLGKEEDVRLGTVIKNIPIN